MAVLIGVENELTSYRALKLLAVSFLEGNVSLSREVVMLESDVEALCPIAKGMVLSTGDAVIGGSCASMMKALCVGGSSSRGGGSIEEAQVDSWMSFGFSNLEVAIETSTDGFDVSSSIAKITSLLSQHLEQQTNKYLVGDSITLADIYITSALYQAKAVGLLTDLSSTSEPLHDYYEHIMSQDCIIQALAILSSIDQPVLPSSSSSTSTTQQLNGPPPAVVSKLYKRHRVRIKELLANSSTYLNGPPVTVAGWTRTTRNANKGQLLFIELNDGSSGTSLQCVLENGITSNYDQSKQSGGAGSSFQLTGTLIESQGDGQDFELKITQSTLLGPVYGGNAQGTEVGGMMYPMSKKAHTLEHMRQHAHLRPRARLHAAAMRIRHAMAFATHNFFHNHGFLYIHTPIVTCADCEGAGEQFGVTTLLGTDHHQPNVEIPVFPPQEEKKLSKKEQKRLAKQKEKDALSTKPIEHKVPGAIDYTQDFFGRRANLTVSGQLNVETHACALSDVYTFGPTFRAENSHTTRHLSEFWMIEPEIAFATLEDDINLAEDYLKYCVQYALEMCADDLEFFENSPFGEAGLRDRLKNVLHSPFKRLTYTEAIEILIKAYKEDGVEFEMEPEWGIDLPSEHERYLCEQVFKKPVVLTNYPKDIKAFYMKLDDDEKTVSAADILVPKIGEIIGGSQREHRTDVLIRRCEEMGLDPKSVWWYIELRKYGTVPHAGFGLGFERLILFITGLDNIRDVIPFPRWAGNAEF